MFLKQYKIISLFLAIFFLTASASAQFDEISSVTKNASYSIRYPEQVKYLLDRIDPNEMWTNLDKLTNAEVFPDRGSSHQSGVAAAKLIKSLIDDMIKTYGRDDAITFTIDTKGYDPLTKQPFDEIQPSIILKIGNSSQPGVVIGGHLDTVECNDQDKKCQEEDMPFPGANDDGSGAVTLLEIARIVLASHMHFNNPIYIIWYAAEEKGEWGSTAVVTTFVDKKIPVRAVLQLDQTGFAYKNEKIMYLERPKEGHYPLVDKDLTDYLGTLILTYVYRGQKELVVDTCHGGSDEWSWSDHGGVIVAPVARPLETDYCNNDHMYHYFHTKYDTMDKISLSHMTDYLKLAVAFVVELAEPTL